MHLHSNILFQREGKQTTGKSLAFFLLLLLLLGVFKIFLPIGLPHTMGIQIGSHQNQWCSETVHSVNLSLKLLWFGCCISSTTPHAKVCPMVILLRSDGMLWRQTIGTFLGPGGGAAILTRNYGIPLSGPVGGMASRLATAQLPPALCSTLPSWLSPCLILNIESPKCELHETPLWN